MASFIKRSLSLRSHTSTGTDSSERRRSWTEWLLRLFKSKVDPAPEPDIVRPGTPVLRARDTRPCYDDGDRDADIVGNADGYDRGCYYCHRDLPHFRHVPVLKREFSVRRSRHSHALPYDDLCFLCSNRLGAHDEHVYYRRSSAHLVQPTFRDFYLAKPNAADYEHDF